MIETIAIFGGLLFYVIFITSEKIIKKLEYTNTYLRLLAVKEYSNDKVIEAESYIKLK